MIRNVDVFEGLYCGIHQATWLVHLTSDDRGHIQGLTVNDKMKGERAAKNKDSGGSQVSDTEMLFRDTQV